MTTPEDPAGTVAEQVSTRKWLVMLAFLLPASAILAGIIVGGELANVAIAGAEPLALMALAIFAYLGATRTWARVAAVAWLFTLILAFCGLILLLALSVTTNLNAQGDPSPELLPGGDRALAATAAGMAIFVSLAILGFTRRARRLASRFLPIDPNSFVHTVALVAVATLTLVTSWPLITLSVPIFLSLPDPQASGAVQDAGTSLRTLLYGLAWTVPATLMAVGFGIKRSFPAALTRLGLVWPTRRHLFIGLGLSLALLVCSQLLTLAISGLWETAGWPLTDPEAVEKLMAESYSPVGALVVGITAGLGEELAIRGVLQPRLGILLSNLFFTSLHAMQYHWDALLTVFVIGVVFGILRNRTNTTTSAIAHGTYDFLAIMAVVLNVPWFS